MRACMDGCNLVGWNTEWMSVGLHWMGMSVD